MTVLSDRDFKIANVLLEEDLATFMAGGKSMAGAYFERELGPGGAVRARRALVALKEGEPTRNG